MFYHPPRCACLRLGGCRGVFVFSLGFPFRVSLNENTNGAYLKEFLGFMGCLSCPVLSESLRVLAIYWPVLSLALRVFGSIKWN
jgi:hypothetical protein